MPSSRTEIWVTYRNAAGTITPPRSGASATLKMVGLTMGSGDSWPAVDLAKVLFNQSGGRQFTSNQVLVGGTTDAAGLQQPPSGIFKAQVAGASAAAATMTAAQTSASAAACAPLPNGHHRRIFFGFSDVATNNTFALGYEEVDQNGKVVPGSQKPAPNQLEQFDPSHTTVCVPLGAGQTPVQETWELVQLSTENHNFHIHQTRFAMTGSNGGVLQDNFPLGVAAPDSTIADQVNNNQNGVCTIAQWRSGHCVSAAKVFDIPFAELGEFVYHCHILEHEDGGMMARIMVVPAPH
jgi:plastocyanin